ncbi:MAG: S49 family peptidase [Chitinophagales bacterium]|nr:S49 family peptidase [Chitinophagales bacterium]
MDKTLLAILSEPMGMMKEAAQAFYAEVLLAATKGVFPVAKDAALNFYNSDVSVISEFGGQFSPEMAEGIAIIGFTDVITKHDRSGSGTIRKADLLQRALANDKVEGVILFFDSPGGMASAPEVMLDVIRNSTKPINAYVDGYCASAAYEIAAACNNIYVKSNYSTVGSIGTYGGYSDFKGILTGFGAKIEDVYATVSTLKNIEIREALKGNTEHMQARVDEFNDMFLASVKMDRGERITDADAFKGKAYLGEAAVKAGLADGIRNLDAVVSEMLAGRSASAEGVKKLVFC